MQRVPVQVKRQSIVSFLNPKQRAALSVTSKRQAAWLHPILAFMNKPLSQKISYIKTTESVNIPDDIIMETLATHHDPIVMTSLLSSLPDNRPLKEKIRKLVQDRIRDRNYRKLIKKTIIQLYFQYLIQNGKIKTIPRFIHTIDSPQVKSIAIVEYIHLAKSQLSTNTIKKWIDDIPDEYMRRKVRID